LRTRSGRISGLDTHRDSCCSSDQPPTYEERLHSSSRELSKRDIFYSFTQSPGGKAHFRQGGRRDQWGYPSSHPRSLTRCFGANIISNQRSQRNPMVVLVLSGDEGQSCIFAKRAIVVGLSSANSIRRLQHIPTATLLWLKPRWISWSSDSKCKVNSNRGLHSVTDPTYYRHFLAEPLYFQL